MTPQALLESEAQAREYCAQLADSAAMERLERFAGLLLAENQRQNLISKASEAHLWQRHIADSVQLLAHVSRETMADDKIWLDLGTGAGFPGLVIAALHPDMRVVLVEARARRADFLAASAERLGLRRCEVLADRLERITPFIANVISARAFAPLEKLLRLSAPFSTKSTCYLLPKGRSAAHELEALKPSIRTMFHVKQSLTDRAAGIIVSKVSRD